MAAITLPSGKNWVVNPSFELAVSPWVAGAMTLSVSSERARYGTSSLRCQVTSATANCYTHLPRSAASTQKIPIKPGDIIHTRALVRGKPGLVVRLQLQTFSAANAVRQTIYSPYTIINDTGWTELIYEGIEATTDTDFYSVLILAYWNGSTLITGGINTTVGDVWYIDGVDVRINEPLDSYFDGSFPGDRFAWVGDPHNSPSIRKAATYSQQAPAMRGKTTISAELWRYTLAGEPLENITHAALSGKVTMNSNAEIKGSLSLKARALNLVTPFVDHIAPFLIVSDPMGVSQRYQMGLYAVPPGKENHTQRGSTVTLEGRDVTWYLANSYPTGVVNYAASANVVDTVKGICSGHGLNVNIPASAHTFGKARTYHPDKSWLQIVNDMLNGIGYYTIWADRFGTCKSVPYFELAGAQPTLELYSGEGSMVINTIEQEGTYEGLANRVVVYKANTQGAPIIASRTNSDPVSPISVASTGRVITRLIADSNIADQATANAMAKRYLEESASYTKKMKVITLPVPDRDLHEVYNLSIYNDADEVIAFGKWWCDQWECEIGFRPVSATMTHHIKRLEPYGGDEQ